MRSIGMEEGRRILPELVSQAGAGKSTLLTRHGQPVAAIVPISEVDRRGRRARLIALRGSGAGLWGASATDAIGRMRDEWSS